MFTTARLKLTFWYLLFIFIITGSLSLLAYTRTSSVLDEEFERIEDRIQAEEEGFIPPGMLMRGPRISSEDIATAKNRIAIQLVIINAGVLVLFGAAGYFLSGETLKPIQLAMEDQKRFVADAAHELRTPITALKTSMEVNLMDDTLAQKAKEILSENLQDLDNLTSLTESLLHLVRQETNYYQSSTTNIIEPLEQAIRQIKPLAEKKKISIRWDKTDTPFAIRGNQESLTRLFVIFLDNAIKYSEENGEVTINTTKVKNQIVVKLTDTGIGIAKHHLPHIFDRFYRVDSSRQKGGYGLGLSVAQIIVEKHNGSISVTSELGQGTTFTISFPIA